MKRLADGRDRHIVGTTAENDAFTGYQGETSFDSDLNTLRVHDGSTTGGFALTRDDGDATFNDLTVTGTLTWSGLAEVIEDTAGAMFTGNTETGITVTYQSADGTVDFVLDTEITDFFAATDITGAEAETLTDGSNASSLHKHVTLDTTTRLNNHLVTGGAIEINNYGTGDRNAFIDFHAEDVTYTDYALRIIRASGANGGTSYIHRGTGTFTIITQDAADLILGTSNTTALTIDKTTQAATFAGAVTGSNLSGTNTGDQSAGDIEAIVNHDNLVGFVAAEHLDWTSDQGASNIHVNNITAVPEAAVTAHEAALTILETQITDGSVFPRLAGTETITGVYTFSRANPQIRFVETGVTAENTTWRILINAEQLAWQLMSDDLGTAVDILTVDRTDTTVDTVNVANGELQVGGNKAWHAGNDGTGSGLDADTVDGIEGASLVQTSDFTYTTPTFSASDYTASGGATWTVQSGDVNTMDYLVSNKHFEIGFDLINTQISVANPGTLKIAIPASKVATKKMRNMIFIDDNGTRQSGYAYVDPSVDSGTTINIQKTDGSTFSTSTSLTIQGQLFFRIN